MTEKKKVKIDKFDNKDYGFCKIQIKAYLYQIKAYLYQKKLETLGSASPPESYIDIG